MEASRFDEALDWLNKGLALEEQIFGRESTRVAESLNNYAELLQRASRPEQAEPMFRRALAIQEKNSGPESEPAAETRVGLAGALSDLGRYPEAKKFYNDALHLFERTDDKKSAAKAAIVYFNLGQIAHSQGNPSESLSLLTHAADVQERVLGKNHIYLARTYRAIGTELFENKAYGPAADFYQRAFRIAEANFGLNDAFTQSVLDRIGSVTLLNAIFSFESKEKLIEDMRKYVDLRRKTSAAARILSSSDRFSADQDVSTADNSGPFGRHLAALNMAKLLHMESEQDLDRESFEIGQLAIQSSADTAIRQMAVRFAKSAGGLGDAVRKRQDLFKKLADLRASLTIAVASGNSDKTAALRQNIADLEREIANLTVQIGRAFPDYETAVHPPPLPASALQGLLYPNEALIVFFETAPFLNVWAVTNEKVVWYAIVDRVATAEGTATERFGWQAVARFRRGLDVDALPHKMEDRFDLHFAHELYAGLFGKIEPEIKGKHHLLIVPSYALTALPFHLLVTDTPTGAGLKAYRDAAWMIKRHAISILPSVRSLESLRKLASKSNAQKPMIGFGDPVFDPARTKPHRARTARRGVSSLSYSSVWRGADVDRKKLGEDLDPLPETALELKTVARSLRASPGDVHLGADASETIVKNAPLRDYRIVYFATHGLVAGDVTGVGEPALALSVPQKPNADDDGLLTASEIAQLKLNADWIVLSACNTASGDKPGADALSGLARAFFYAGARALLVSHWSVRSEAAVRLTTQTFQNVALHPEVGRAEALRLAMLGYLNDPFDATDAYPAFWGPFSIIGEGTARQ